MNLNLPLDALTIEVVMARWPENYVLMASEFTCVCAQCVRARKSSARSILSVSGKYMGHPKAVRLADAPTGEFCVSCGAPLHKLTR